MRPLPERQSKRKGKSENALNRILQGKRVSFKEEELLTKKARHPLARNCQGRIGRNLLDRKETSKRIATLRIVSYAARKE